MARLVDMTCPRCGVTMVSEEYEPDEDGKAPDAESFSTCLRRCESCGVGYSNAAKSSPTRICRDPFSELAPFVSQGVAEVLAQSLNSGSREKKRIRFGFSTSEDHVTWTVFRYLQLVNGLARAVSALDLLHHGHAEREPALFLWGSEVPAGIPNGSNVRRRLEQIEDDIGENPGYRSEPDVILDLPGTGLVFIEVKVKERSNSRKSPGCSKWDKYVHDTEAFAGPDDVRQTGLYELARNWRLAWELAGERPFTLVNLAQDVVFGGANRRSLDAFSAAIALSERRRFVEITWRRFVRDALPDAPEWLSQYLVERVPKLGRANLNHG